MVEFSTNTVDSKWVSHVNEIKSFVDETYSIDLRGNLEFNHEHRLAWGRIGLEKFYARVIPILSDNNRNTRKFKKIVRVAVKDTITFGNSTIIISNDGAMRVSSPSHSFASKDAFGRIIYKEFFGEKNNAFGKDGILYNLVIDEDGNKQYIDLGDRYFSIFYSESTDQPKGKSRLSPAIRNTIKAASRNRARVEEGADHYAFPMRILNGIFDDFANAGIEEGKEQGEMINEVKHKIQSGVDKVIGLPIGPNGEKMTVDEFSSSDFTPFTNLHQSFAKDVASAFNIDVTELGVTSAVPSSAEALYASKEDLILEVEAFESGIEDSLQEALDYYTEVIDSDDCELSWAPPATPSSASQADAFVKYASVIPQMAYSRNALLEAGISVKVVEELLEKETVEISPERLKELEDGFVE